MREAISERGNCKKLALLSGLTINDSWMTNENNEGDPPNMDFMRQLWKEYFEYAQKIGIPLFERPFLEKVGKYLISLFRQDSAYFERMGGVAFFFIYNAHSWKGRGKAQRLKLIKEAHAWWNEEDKRERTRPWIDNVFTCLENGYQKREFWEKSVNFIIDWLIEHKDALQFDPSYDPKKWFGRDKGALNVKVHAGEA